MVDPTTGQVRWHNPNVAACSAYVGHVLCDTTDTHGIALVDPNTGATRWTAPHSETLQGAASSFRAIVGGQAYVGDGQTPALTAVDLATGQVRWHHDTGIDLLTQAFPLDADHVAVAGLHTSPTGSTEQLVSMDAATGATSVLYAGTATNGTNTSNGGVDLVRAGDRQYFVVVDPDGSIRTLDTTGKQLASVPTACGGGAASVVGDTVACPSNGVLTLYAVPGLARRSTIPFDASKVASFHVFGNACVLEESGKLTGLK
jgi:outer membrane protein assembly factor BamB